MNNLKRLQKELQQLAKEPPQGCTAAPIDNDLYHWHATIFGPKGTAFENGVFQLDIIIPSDYPFKPPKCKFETKIFHPNISQKGDICLDILSKNWQPILGIAKVLMSIQSLLDDANPSDPLNADAAELMQKSKVQYEEKVKHWIQQYACK